MLKVAALLLIAVALHMSDALPTHPDTLNTVTIKTALQGINNYYKKKGDLKVRTAVELMTGGHELKFSSYVQSTFTIRVTTGSYVEDCKVVVTIPIKAPKQPKKFQGDPTCQKVA
ncbi:hypothetical protein Btru_065735 [Bulinus truncatus]|nr:hypothetical protein Btru_065735 [Bulinus truncatus]